MDVHSKNYTLCAMEPVIGEEDRIFMLQGQTIEHYVMPVRASHERGTEEAVYRKTTSDF